MKSCSRFMNLVYFYPLLSNWLGIFIFVNKAMTPPFFPIYSFFYRHSKRVCNFCSKMNRAILLMSTELNPYFFFFFGKYSSTGQLIIHLRAAQWWAERYYKDPQGIFEKKKELGCHHILGKKHKQFLLKCIDENLFADLTEIVEHLL